jgi:hypothetical protein
VKKNNKKAVFVGVESPIRIKSKKYVMEILYKRAKRNPFIADKTYEEYLNYIKEQVKMLEGIEISASNEEELYTALKNIGWLKEFNAFLFYVVLANYGIS